MPIACSNRHHSTILLPSYRTLILDTVLDVYVLRHSLFNARWSLQPSASLFVPLEEPVLVKLGRSDEERPQSLPSVALHVFQRHGPLSALHALVLSLDFYNNEGYVLKWCRRFGGGGRGEGGGRGNQGKGACCSGSTGMNSWS